jgi:hypothetical protein
MRLRVTQQCAGNNSKLQNYADRRLFPISKLFPHSRTSTRPSSVRRLRNAISVLGVKGKLLGSRGGALSAALGDGPSIILIFRM